MRSIKAIAALAIVLSVAEAIKVEADALKDNPGSLELRAIERWSGEMPSYIGGGGQLPFINLPAPNSPKKNEENQKQ
jgi:hypothetical protein